MSQNVSLRGSVYDEGEEYDVIQDHADLILAIGAGEIVEPEPEPAAEPVEPHNEGNGAADRDAIDHATLAAEAAQPAEPSEAPAELAEAVEPAQDAPAETVEAEAAPAADEGAAPA